MSQGGTLIGHLLVPPGLRLEGFHLSLFQQLAQTGQPDLGVAQLLLRQGDSLGMVVHHARLQPCRMVQHP